MSCYACNHLQNRQLYGFGSALRPSTYGGIATSAQINNRINVNWHSVLESAIVGVLVAVISSYILKEIK